ncbi:MAG TPA: hypothetical protein PKH21_02290 [Candidatus Cloacimonadota bacterium]|nr:hypothetical protein [Candidatus Cloacimonadota bacterium]HQL13358.1 hypothetical protein [Candidatus Cloacimonadota bacterium]HQP16956.1 hypothetical protein [Candidatus Cloacimonadota bacterium]HRS50143.1 hypothetical protein [Candidatus Cloacimonadota bacterium]
MKDSIHCNLHVPDGSQSLFRSYLNRSRFLHRSLGGLRLLLDFGRLETGIASDEDEFKG